MATNIEWEMTVVLLVAVRSEQIGVVQCLKKVGRLVHTDDPNLLNVFYLQHGELLTRVLLAKSPDPSQGGDAAAWITTHLAEKYKPYAIAMVGICAGNPSLLKLGDVVVASATARHDYGKIVKARSLKNRSGTLIQQYGQKLVLQHRGELCKVSDPLAPELSAFLSQHYPSYSYRVKRTSSKFNVAFGVMATGNQVIKVSGIFEYLNYWLRVSSSLRICLFPSEIAHF